MDSRCVSPLHGGMIHPRDGNYRIPMTTLLLTAPRKLTLTKKSPAIEARNFTDILYFQRICFVPNVFCLSSNNGEVFAGQQIKTNGKERDTRALIKAEVVQGCERERIAHEGN